MKYDTKYKDCLVLLYITFRKTEIQAQYRFSLWAEQDSAVRIHILKKTFMFVNSKYKILLNRQSRKKQKN